MTISWTEAATSWGSCFQCYFESCFGQLTLWSQNKARAVSNLSLKWDVTINISPVCERRSLQEKSTQQEIQPFRCGLVFICLFPSTSTMWQKTRGSALLMQSISWKSTIILRSVWSAVYCSHKSAPLLFACGFMNSGRVSYDQESRVLARTMGDHETNKQEKADLY